MWINKRVTVGGGFNGTLQSKYRVYLDPVWSVKQMSRLLTLYMRYAYMWIQYTIHCIWNECQI